MPDAVGSVSILECLYQFNVWANGRIVDLCRGLTDAQLDEPRAMGFGSLRKTLFHVMAAEQIWLERWSGEPWRPLETDPQGMTPDDIARQLEATNARRRTLLAAERHDNWSRVIVYRDAKGNEFRGRLTWLALHVANHGVHHRAQLLSFLKSFGRTVPGGLDFLFYRLAYPFLPQMPETTAAMRQYGLAVAEGTGLPLCWDRELLSLWFRYGDWANQKLLELTAQVDDAALDRDWGMGMGSIRKTLLHILDAERWWLKNWLTGPSAFERAPVSTTLPEVSAAWQDAIARRNEFRDNLAADGAARVVECQVGPMSVRIPVIESLVQLCGHGTHHRAQWINMLRSSGVATQNIDLVFWDRQQAAPS
jgi:uncharacterized damage-inducible protein DinB